MPRQRDREAADRTETNRIPKNLEEQAQASHEDGGAPAPGPGIVETIKDAVQTAIHGYCKLCDRAAMPDPRGTHVCARCRSEFTPEIAARKKALAAETRKKKLAVG